MNDDVKLRVISEQGPREEYQDAAASRVTENNLTAVLCDGLGAYSLGKEAASMVAQYIADNADSEIGLAQLVRNANRKLLEDAEHGFTTVAAVRLDRKEEGTRLSLCNCGDTRIYLLRNRDIMLLSFDHTTESSLLGQGADAEAAHYYRKLTSCLGLVDVELYTTQMDIQKDDIIFMATDGAYDLFTEKELRKIGPLLSEDKMKYMLSQIQFRKKELDDNATCMVIKILATGKEKTFKHFKVDESNESAYVVAQGIVAGIVYNPVFLYGATAVGKTHLVTAIKNELERRSSSKVAIVECTDMLEKWIGKMEGKSPGAYTRLYDDYKDLDVLIIENIQYLSGKRSTQMEVAQMLCQMVNENKRVVCTSTKSVQSAEFKELRYIIERNERRNLEVHISLPGWELKVQFLEELLKQNKVTVSEEVQELILIKAGKFSDIKGILRQAKLYSTLYQCEIDEKIIRKVIGERM